MGDEDIAAAEVNTNNADMNLEGRDKFLRYSRLRVKATIVVYSGEGILLTNRGD